jgi:outer membrane biosynthesis protein TonB
MKKVIRLTENDLVRLIKKVINEQDPGLATTTTTTNTPTTYSQPEPTTKTASNVKPNVQAKPKVKQQPKQSNLQNQYDFWNYDNEYINTGKKTHSGIVIQKNGLNKTASNTNKEFIKISAKTLRGENIVMVYKCGNSFMEVKSGGANEGKKITNEDLISDLKQSICPQG